MAKQIVDTGTVANDGTGDSGRDAFTKINENFTELYDEYAALNFEAVATPPSGLINTPTHMLTLDSYIDHMWSSTIVDGAGITDNLDGTVDIGETTVMIRATDTGHVQLKVARVAATVGLVLTDNATNYVYMDYNAGAPIVVATLNPSVINVTTAVPMYVIVREGNSVLILGSLEEGVDANAKLRKRFFYTEKYARVDGGSVITESGIRNLFCTAG